MSYRHREIEVKLLVKNTSLDAANEVLASLFGKEKSRLIFGASLDTYWHVLGEVKADFIRMRERDGIRQITVKGKDKGHNLNRLEIDIDSTSSVNDIAKLLTAAHGKPAGKIGKTYYVYWLGRSEYETVCAYAVHIDGETYPHTVVEVETTSEERMQSVEKLVVCEFQARGMTIERAPGSLYEMFIKQPEGEK